MAACISDRLGSFAMTRDLAMLERVPTFAGLTPDTLEFLLERASEVVVRRRRGGVRRQHVNFQPELNAVSLESVQHGVRRCHAEVNMRFVRRNATVRIDVADYL